MRFEEDSSSSGTRHCLICNEGLLGGGRDAEESQGDPSSRFPITGEDVKVLDKLFKLELEEEMKLGFIGLGIGSSSILTSSTSCMPSTSPYCVSCSFKVWMLFQLWADLEGIQTKIRKIRTEFLQNIERTLPQIPPGSSAHAIKLKVLEKTSRSQVVVTDSTLTKPMTCSSRTPEEARTTGCGSGKCPTILNPNALSSISGELAELPRIIGSNNIKDDPQTEPQPKLEPSSAKVEVNDEVQNQPHLFPNLIIIRSEGEHEPKSQLVEDPIFDDIIAESAEGQFESSLEEQGLSKQTIQESTSETVSGFERHEETATYTENETNASLLLTCCPEVEQCGSKEFKSLKLLRNHFFKEHLTSERNKVFYRGQVQTLTFKCQVCLPSKYFSYKFNLDRHMTSCHEVTITSISLLICPEVTKCGSKGYHALDLLRRHFVKEHFDSEKTTILYKGQVQFLIFKCPVCPILKAFTRHSSLKKHMENVHKVAKFPKVPSLPSSIDEDDESEVPPSNSNRSGFDFDHSQCSDDSDSDHSNESDHSSSNPTTIQQPSRRRHGLRRKQAVNYSAVLDSGDSDNMDNDDIDSIRLESATNSKNNSNLAEGMSQHILTLTQVQEVIIATNDLDIPESQDQVDEDDIKIDLETTYEPLIFSNSTVGMPSEENIPRVMTLTENEVSVRSDGKLNEESEGNTTMTPPRRKRGRPQKYYPTPQPLKMAKFSNGSSKSENGSKQLVASNKPRGRPKGTGKSKCLASLKSNQRSNAQNKGNLDPMDEDVNSIRDTEKFQFMVPILKLHRLQLPSNLNPLI